MKFHSTSFSELTIYHWILIAVIIFSQSIFLFTDAQKRNANKWFWGIWALTTAPLPFVFYMIFVRKIFGKKSNKE